MVLVVVVVVVVAVVVVVVVVVVVPLLLRDYLFFCSVERLPLRNAFTAVQKNNVAAERLSQRMKATAGWLRFTIFCGME